MLNFMEATGFVSSEDEFGVNADPLQTEQCRHMFLEASTLALVFDA